MTNSLRDYVEEQRELIRRQGFLLERTQGCSMRPLIWGRMHVVAVGPLDGEPQVGDILLFRQEQPDGSQKNIVHRLVEVRGHGAERVYVMRGDNNLAVERVRPEEVIGRVEEVHRVAAWRPWHVVWARKFAADGCAQRAYARLWRALWPLRRQTYRLRGLLGRLLQASLQERE